MSGRFRYALLAARVLRCARARIRPQRSAPPEHTIAMLAGLISVAAARRRRRRTVLIAGVATGMLGLALVLSFGLKRASLPSTASWKAAPAAKQRFVAEGNALASVKAASGDVQPLLIGQEWHDGERLRSDALPVALTGSDGTTIEDENRPVGAEIPGRGGVSTPMRRSFRWRCWSRAQHLRRGDRDGRRRRCETENRVGEPACAQPGAKRRILLASCGTALISSLEGGPTNAEIL